MSVLVLVQAAPGRDATWKRCRASIEASDIGTSYHRVENPRGVVPKDFFVSLLREAESATEDWVLRLEDDALVNRYLLHNVRTWEALAEPDFGMGWLFVPKSYARRGDGHRGTHERIYRSRDIRRHRGVLHGAVGVLMRRTDVPWIREHVERWNRAQADPAGFDISLTEAVDFRPDRTLFLHNPPIVEHIPGPSALGHHGATGVTTGGMFQPEFRREVPSVSELRGPPLTGKRRAVILAAGDQARWRLPTPKQLFCPGFGIESLIARGVRLARERGYEPVVAARHPELLRFAETHRVAAAVPSAMPGGTVSHTLLSTRELWGEEGTLVLLGDTFYAEADLDFLLQREETACLARADEIFAFSVPGAETEAFYRAAQRVAWDAAHNPKTPPSPIQSRGKLFQLHRALAGWPLDPPRGFIAAGWPVSDLTVVASEATRDYDVMPH